ncbi:MAG TPA: hypothetical protein VE442_09275 [Jatrophihabitans sp.]|nr:hypothetical protein [Jatrophihabitans sp.]
MANLPDLLIALGAVGLLTLVTRWAFRPSRPNVHPTRPVDASEAEDLGLLVVVVSGLTRQEALGRRAVLGDAGIRSSMSTRRDGRMDVLVFRADGDRARVLLGP